MSGRNPRERTRALRLRSRKAKRQPWRLAFAASVRAVLWLRGQDLNLRPLGYEPNELPDCSTSRLEYGVYHAARRCDRSEPCACEGIEEAAAVLVADEARGTHLLAARVEEDRAGRAEQAEAPQELAVQVVVGGDIGLQEQRAGELLLHRQVAEGEALHLLARHAPVGVEVEQHWPARRAYGGVELVDAANELEDRRGCRARVA